MNKTKLESNKRAGEETSTCAVTAPCAAGDRAAKSPRTCAVEVSSKLLNRIDDIRVDLLKALPRPWRAKVTDRLFIEILLTGIATQYETDSNSGLLLIEELRAEFSKLPEYPS